MKKFRATAKDRNGNRYAGVFEAADEADARAKLKAEQYVVLSLEEIPGEEEDPELHEKLTPKKISPDAPHTPSAGAPKSAAFQEKKKRPTGLLKVLFFAAIILGLIPLLISFFSPPEPEVSAQETVQEYFNLQCAGDFAAQWSLLSEEIQAVYLSPEKYAAAQTARSRRQTSGVQENTESENTEEPEALSVGAVAAVYEEKQKAEYTAFLESSEVQERYLVRLQVENGSWRILTAELVKTADPNRSVPRVSPAAGAVQRTDTSAAIEDESGRKSRGLEEMRAKALQMLETAYQQGKMTRSEYLKKKQSLGEVSS